MGLIDRDDAERAVKMRAHEPRGLLDDGLRLDAIAALTDFISALDPAARHAIGGVLKHRAWINQKPLIIEFAVRIRDQTLVA